MHDPLSDEEFGLLDDLLLETPGMDRAMDLCALDGYLAALACAPVRSPPERWIPWVWDAQKGRSTPAFTSDAEARETFDLILRHAHDIAWTLQNDPAGYQPILMEGSPEGAACADPDCQAHHPAAAEAPVLPADPPAAAEPSPAIDAADAGATLFVDPWCAGFLRGMALDAPLWDGFVTAEAPMLDLLRQHGAPGNEGHTHLPPEEHAGIEALLTAFVLRAHAHFAAGRVTPADDGAGVARLPDTPLRLADKVGRNDPCPCGSGRKAKRCCHP